MRESGGNVNFSHGGGSDSADKANSNGASERRTRPPDASSGVGSSGIGVAKRSSRRKKREGKENDEKIVTIEVPIVETSENKDAEELDANDEGYEHSLSVGDFVWGKIKSHPWWPGRIYASSDASDYALKLRQKNRLLVAYFGDGTFAWCHPSQLKPFEENFGDMVKQSSSRAFVNAVQDAVNEIGRLLHLKITSSSVTKKSMAELAPLLAKNSGIKDGVLVPEDGIDKLSTVLSDPAELLSQVKRIAEAVAVSSILELEILKVRLSAFYLSRGGYKLPNYHLPQPVPGLEGNSKNETVDKSNNKGTVNAPVQGPVEEDYFSLPVSPKVGEISHPVGTSGSRLHHRRKQKSIAEIIKEDNDLHTKVKEGDKTEEVMNLGKLRRSSGRNKKKINEDTVTAIHVPKIKGSPEYGNQNVAIAKSDGSGGKESTDKGTLSHLKKKKENISNHSNESKMERDEGPVLKEENFNKKDGEEKIEKGYLSRERKKSKYLSPPFTTPSRGQRKGDKDSSVKVSSEPAAVPESVPKDPPAVQENTPKEPAAVQEKILEEPAAVQENIPKEPAVVPETIPKEPTAVQEIVPKESVAVHGNIPKEPAIEHGLSDRLNSQIPKEENKTIDLKKIQAPSGEVLLEIRSAAINPRTPKEVGSVEKIVGFVSIFRSAIYRQGSYYAVYNKRKRGRKRKNPESEPGVLRKHENKTDHDSLNQDSEKMKRRKKTEIASDTPKQKQASENKTRKKRTKENASDKPEQKQASENKIGKKRIKENASDTPEQKGASENKVGKKRTKENASDMPEQKQASENKVRKKRTRENASDVPEQKQASENKGGNKRIKENASDTPKQKQASENKKGKKRTKENSSDTPEHRMASENSKTGKKGTKENASDKLKQEQVAESKKTGRKGTKGKGAILIVLFGPGSSLPSKAELIKLYSKYGALNEAETDVFFHNYTARVYFLKTSDAEEAFNQSKNVNPFGSCSVKFELQNLSRRLKSGEHGEKSQTKASPAKKKGKTPAKPSAASHSPAIEASKLNFIKQKLEVMTSILEGSGGKSSDMKKKLEIEIKGLLEDVNKMAESSSS